ncbi:hypothetical protein A5N15_04640 [Rothia kristinae]|uniref:Uncharacterized protein n=1 Tax=Rothia kristinae TaxID=37923 RepID=A0A657IVH4_9MICC|nr:hypothetical protein A5N15_04640 [Rothia kristinae]
MATARRWKETTWVRTRTVPECTRTGPQSRVRSVSSTETSVMSRAWVQKSGCARVTSTAPPASSSSSTCQVRPWCT